MAAKIKTSITLSQEAIDEAEALSANDAHRYSVSSVIETLIHEAYAKRDANLKRVEPAYETIGKRKKLVGFNGWYGDHQVVYLALTAAQAQAMVDDYAHEELSK